MKKDILTLFIYLIVAIPVNHLIMHQLGVWAGFLPSTVVCILLFIGVRTAYNTVFGEND